MIGPNGGGKTNLQRILIMTLNKYFLHQYQFFRDDNNVKIERHDPWQQRMLERAFPPYLGEEMLDRTIEIELIPEKSDIRNIKAIGENIDKFNNRLLYWEKKYEQYKPYRYIESISDAEFFTYKISNLKLQETPEETAAWGFLEYLREFFIFLRVVDDIPEVELTSPVFFFSSDRTLNKRFEVQVGQLTEQAYFDGYRSSYQAAMGENMNLMQWGAQHFARLHRRAVIEGSKHRTKTWQDFFNEYSDVSMLTKYLQKLGYHWNFLTDVDQLSYSFLLEKDGEKRTSEMFSSGEREVVHFLLAMFALNVRDGLILVDEPELHLHPRWQKIFLNLFKDLVPERNNQFIVTTHSPIFVTPETIDCVTRIFRHGKSGSERVALREVNLPEKKNLVRMINSQNNERLFFADKVVLVEGITDRIVFESLIEAVAARANNSEAIEVVEVGGKNNFRDYETVLKGLRTPAYTVADRDYLNEVGGESVRGSFEANSERQWRALIEGKKSFDKAALLAHLRDAIAGRDTDELKKFWDYFRSRLTRLKDSLTPSEAEALSAEISRLRDSNVFVLRLGEVEDYLPPGVRDIRSIVEMTSDPHWINNVESREARVEIGEIVCRIVGVSEASRTKLIAELTSGEVSFSRGDDGEQARAMRSEERGAIEGRAS